MCLCGHGSWKKKRGYFKSGTKPWNKKQTFVGEKSKRAKLGKRRLKDLLTRTLVQHLTEKFK